jgi:hypothetical protein
MTVDLSESTEIVGGIHVNVVAVQSHQALPASTVVPAGRDVEFSAVGGDGESGLNGGDGENGTDGDDGINATEVTDATVRIHLLLSRM